MDGEVYIYKTWRSEIKRLCVFGVLCLLSVILSRKIPGSVIEGELFSMGSHTLYLSLPLFFLLPMFSLIHILLKIYDVQYIFDRRGIRATVGRLSINQRIHTARFEDIRSIEPDQTILERFLDIGNVEIGTSATAKIEIILEGVEAPHEIVQMIQGERDRRARESQENNTEESTEKVLEQAGGTL